jgi:hypothetical protein
VNVKEEIPSRLKIEGLAEAKAGHYIQVVTAYLASGVGGTVIVFHEENRSGKYIIQDS